MKWERCDNCDGVGKLRPRLESLADVLIPDIEDCPECSGSGYVAKEKPYGSDSAEEAR